MGVLGVGVGIGVEVVEGVGTIHKACIDIQMHTPPPLTLPWPPIDLEELVPSRNGLRGLGLARVRVRVRVRVEIRVVPLISMAGT